MKVTQKVLISLLIATVLFTTFAVAAFSGLYDLIDTRFYDQRVRAAGRSLLAEAQAVTVEYQDEIRDEIVSLVELPAIRNVFLINQSRQDTEEQARAIGALFDRRPEIEFIRIYDNEAGELWFSTLEEDVRSRSDVRIEYRPVGELVPEPGLPAPDEEDSAISWRPERGAIRVVVPVVDTFEIPRGILVAWVRLSGLYARLLEENLVAPSVRVQMSPDGYVVYNARRHFNEDDLSAIDRVIGDSEVLPLLRSDLGESYAIEYRVPEGTGVPPGVFLISEQDLHMDRGLRIILLAAVFVVGFLLSYLVLNLRQEPAVVVTERFRRFQQAVLRDYLREGRAIEPELWKRELDSRREQIEGELKRGIGRLNEDRRVTIEQEMGRRWDELYRLIGSQASAKTELEPVSLAQIEAIIERTLARHGSIAGTGSPPRKTSAKKPSPSSPAVTPSRATADDDLESLEETEEVETLDETGADEGPFAGMRPVEVETVDEDEDLEEIEEIAEVEEAEAEDLEEIEELEEESADEGSFAGMRPVEVETVDEDESLEEIEEIEEIAESTEAEVEDLEEIEEVAEIEDLEEIEEIAEAEEAEAEDLEEIEELEEESADEGSFAGMRPVEVETVDEDESLEEIEEIEESTEAEVEDLEEIEEVAEVEDLDEMEEIAEVEEAEAAAEEGKPEDLEEIAVMEEVPVAAPAVRETWETETLGPLGEHPKDLFAIDGTALEKAEAQALSRSTELEGAEELPAVRDDETDSLEFEEAEAIVEIEEPEDLEEIEEAEPEDLQEIEEAEAEDLEEIEDIEEIEEFAEYVPDSQYEDLEQLEEIDVDDREAISATEIAQSSSSFFSLAESFGGRAYMTAPIETEAAESPGKRSVFRSEEFQKGPIRIRGVESIASYHVVEIDDFINVLGRSRDIIERHRGTYRVRAEAYKLDVPDLDAQLVNIADQVIRRREIGGIDDVFGDSLRDLDFGDVLSDEVQTQSRTDSDSGLRLGSDGFVFAAIGETGEAGMRHVYRGLVRLTRRWDARVAVIFELDADGNAPGLYSLGMPEECEDQLGLAATAHLVRNVMSFRRVCLLKEPLNRFQGYESSCSANRLTAIASWLFLPLQSPDRVRYLAVGFPRSYEDLIELSGKLQLLSRGV